MAAGRTIGLALLWAVIGAVAGGAAGLGLGLAYITVAQTSSFEGYSGYLVGLWMLVGIVLGLVAGIITGVKRANSSPPG